MTRRRFEVEQLAEDIRGNDVIVFTAGAGDQDSDAMIDAIGLFLGNIAEHVAKRSRAETERTGQECFSDSHGLSPDDVCRPVTPAELMGSTMRATASRNHQRMLSD